MNTIVMIAAATMGQFFDCPPPPICQPQIYTTPVYTAPTDYVFLELDGMREQTRSYELIEYGTKRWRVPVINGYVPDVSWCKLSSGGYKIRYDYSARTPLDECVVCDRFVPAKSNQPRQTSRGGALPRIPPEPLTPAPVEEINPAPPAPRKALVRPKSVPIPVEELKEKSSERNTGTSQISPNAVVSPSIETTTEGKPAGQQKVRGGINFEDKLNLIKPSDVIEDTNSILNYGEK